MATLDYKTPRRSAGRSPVQFASDLIVGSALFGSGMLHAVVLSATRLDGLAGRRFDRSGDMIKRAMMRISKGKHAAVQEKLRQDSTNQLRDRYGS